MMKHAIPLAALLIAAPLAAAPPPSEGWTLISEGDDRDTWIRDKDWMAGLPDTASAFVWSWIDHKRNATVSHEMILLEINCPAETYRFAQMQSYSKRGKSTSLGGSRWEFAAPETIIGEVVRVTCMEPEAPAQQRQVPQRELW